MNVIEIIGKIDIEKLKEKKNNKHKICPECKMQENIIINGERICKKCGLVLSGTSNYVGNRKVKYPYGLNLKTH